MIFPSQAVRIVIATKPVDFRKGHDGLAAVAEHELGLDPHSGVIVVFRAKRGDRIKVLLWDPQAPWQRGSNENTNRLLRQYFPKGTDISGFSQAKLSSALLHASLTSALERPCNTRRQQRNLKPVLQRPVETAPA